MSSKSVLFILIVLTISMQQSRAESSSGLSRDTYNKRHPKIEILKYISNMDKDGYQFEYDSEDGSHREESGSFIDKGGKLILQVKGTYSYLDPAGHQHIVGYKADDEGTKTGAEVISSSFGEQKDRDKQDKSTPPPALVAGQGILNSLSRGK